jgi:hypothetical protein
MPITGHGEGLLQATLRAHGYGTRTALPKLVDIYAALLPALPIEPGVHVNYSETVLHIHDGKPKFRDVPTEMGGSGGLPPE